MSSNLRTRPVVYDHRPSQFLRALMDHYKATSNFSVRHRSNGLKGLSPALVSQVLAEKRRLTRNQLPLFAKLFKLTQFEVDYLDQCLTKELLPQNSVTPEIERTPLQPKNHILSSWLHIYVKDLVNLKGFSTDTKTLHRMLKGLASPMLIAKSVEFLLREGFWRRTPQQKIVPEDPALISTGDIPSQKIRAFHKKALSLAMRGLEIFPMEQRKASTVLISVDKDKLPELRDIVDSFQTQLLKFIEDHPAGQDHLVQVIVHLTPVGGADV